MSCFPKLDRARSDCRMAKSVLAERRRAYHARPAATLYKRDFYRWTTRQSSLLRAGRLNELDLENLAEEIDSLGGRDRRELQSRLIVLLVHLLKWERQPRKRSRS